jgi:excisionase family DNA binding protein
MHRVNRRSLPLHFVTGNSLLSVGDIAKETGLTRQRIWQLAKAGQIPAERAAGKQHRFHESPVFAAWRKEKAEHPRASQISRRRQYKIDKLREILWNRTEVTAQEKEAALSYVDCLFMLWRGRRRKEAFPLLEGIHALYGSKISFENGMEYWALRFFIADLPTAAETTPQTEQSSLNVSAERRTTLSRHARH